MKISREPRAVSREDVHPILKFIPEDREDPFDGVPNERDLLYTNHEMSANNFKVQDYQSHSNFKSTLYGNVKLYEQGASNTEMVSLRLF